MSSKTILQIVFAFRVKIAKDSKGGKFIMIKKCILISCLIPALVNKGLRWGLCVVLVRNQEKSPKLA